MPAVAAAQQGDLLARHVEVGEHGFLVVVEDLGADGDLDVHRGGAGAGTVGARAVAALLATEMLGVAEVDQGVEVLHGLEHDIRATAAIAAVGTAELDEALAAEGDDAVAAIAGAAVDFCLIEEFHGSFKREMGAGWCRPPSQTGTGLGVVIRRRRPLVRRRWPG